MQSVLRKYFDRGVMALELDLLHTSSSFDYLLRRRLPLAGYPSGFALARHYAPT